MSEKRSVSEELMALLLGPDYLCHDSAKRIEALAARVEAIAGEIRRGEHSVERGRDDLTPRAVRRAWAAELAPEKEGE